MTNNESQNSDQQAQYNPETDHYCDGAITYTEDITIPVCSTESYDNTQEIDAECQICGRSMTIVIDVTPDWLKTIDQETGETLHEY